MSQVLPKYPIYIPSKGRYESGYTAKFLLEDRVPFYLVVEEQERDEYAKRYGADHVLVLPFSNKGTVVASRNWIKDHATKNGFARHWQLDDNMTWIGRRWRTRRIRCSAGVGLRAVEDFADRYENVAIAGMN